MNGVGPRSGKGQSALGCAGVLTDVGGPLLAAGCCPLTSADNFCEIPSSVPRMPLRLSGEDVALAEKRTGPCEIAAGWTDELKRPSNACMISFRTFPTSADPRESRALP